MTIVSLSLPEELLGSINKIARRHGFANRSDFVRHAVRSAVSEAVDLGEDDIAALATITVISERRGSKDIMSAVQHAYESIITAQLHAHLDERNCLEVLVVKGHAMELRDLLQKIRAVRGVKQARLVAVSRT